MKKITLKIISLALAISSVNFSAYAEDKEYNMSVNDSVVTDKALKELYGINMEWSTGVHSLTQVIDSQNNVVMRPSFPKE